jgi:hypothetical protein
VVLVHSKFDYSFINALCCTPFRDQHRERTTPSSSSSAMEPEGAECTCMRGGGTECLFTAAGLGGTADHIWIDECRMSYGAQRSQWVIGQYTDCLCSHREHGTKARTRIYIKNKTQRECGPRRRSLLSLSSRLGDAL